MDLIEGWKDIVGKLDFSDWPQALGGSSYGEAYKTLLAEWCVEHAFCAKVGGEVHCATEDATELDVFAKNQHPLVSLQGMAKGFVDSGVEVDAFGLAFAYVLWQLRVGKSCLGSVVQERRRVVLQGQVESCTGCCC